MTQQDGAIFFRSVFLLAALFIGMLYLFESGYPLGVLGLRRAHKAIWRKPRRWQFVLVCVLWGFIVTSMILLVWMDRPS